MAYLWATDRAAGLGGKDDVQVHDDRARNRLRSGGDLGDRG